MKSNYVEVILASSQQFSEILCVIHFTYFFLLCIETLGEQVMCLKVLADIAHVSVHSQTLISSEWYSSLSFSQFSYLLSLPIYVPFKVLVQFTMCYFICPDIDECEDDMENNCDIVNGLCNNTNGSYHCSCNMGYSGDGIICTGT